MGCQNSTVAFIDLSALKNNLEVVKRKFPEKRIILPVKANAYGHGAVLIAREAEKMGINSFAVARLEEGIQLRMHGISGNIMMLGAEWEEENILLALRNRIEFTVSCAENIRKIEQAANKINQTAFLHLKINTGMNRLGADFPELENICGIIRQGSRLKLLSLFTHFAKSEENLEETYRQVNVFLEGKALVEKFGIHPEFYHLCNSGGVENLDPCRKGLSSSSAVRPGIMVYGYSQKLRGKQNDGLIPVMNLCSRVIHLRKVRKGVSIGYGATYCTFSDCVLATVPVGYGDGVFRAVSNNLLVRINGKNYPQRGRLSMDLMVVEVDSSVRLGDWVVIFGNKDYAAMDAVDLAVMCGTISYEITTNIAQRVKRKILTEDTEILKWKREIQRHIE